MGQKKLPRKANCEQSVKDVFSRHDFNALDEMIKLLTEKVYLKPGDEEFIDSMLEDREVVRLETGEQVMQLKVKHKINLLCEIAQYQAPKLRSTETKGQIDYNFNITIKQFKDVPEAPRIVDVTPKELTE